MDEHQLKNLQRRLEIQVIDIGVRIRRYTLDTRLKDTAALSQLNELHDKWLGWRKEFYDQSDAENTSTLSEIERGLLAIDRHLDVIQRDLVSEDSFHVGSRTVALLSLSLALLGEIYLVLHGLGTLNVAEVEFEPWAVWGPLKYLEVAFWAEFGVLCYLLLLAANYIKRRDFDKWYQPWYLSTALRAPFLTVILMVLVLEFVEWYGEDTWMRTYLLEDGNKFYFMVFMSFCMGLVSDQASEVMRELAESVIEFVHGITKNISQKLSSAIAPVREMPR